MSEQDHILALVDDLLRLAEGSSAATIEVEAEGLLVKVTRRPPGRESAGVSRERGVAGGPAPTKSDDRTQRVHATTVGVFSAAREWTAGDAVTRGDVLGGIQSLGRVANITAPADGEIKDVLITGGAPVEYGQPLFVIAVR